MSKRFGMLLPVLLVTGAMLPRSAAAQGERITLRGNPVPNQTVHVGMSQEMAFDIVMEGMSMGPMRMEGVTRFSTTQQVGAPDAQGRITALVIWDDVAVDLKMNGNPMGAGAASPLIGKTISIVYDAQGKLVDVQIPAELGEAGNSVKQMLTSLSGSIPNVTLGVGDTVTVPISIPIPIPLPGAQAATMESRTTSKLVAIELDGSDRIAVLDQVIEATLNQPLDMPGPSGTMSVNLVLKMSGTGKLRLNVDKGFVQAGNSDMKIEMTMLMQGMTMKMNGTMRVVMTGTSQPAH